MFKLNQKMRSQKMKNFYKYSLLLLTIMILTVSAASAADADDMANMTSVDDSTDTLANDENSFSTLQNDVEGEGTSESSTDNDNELLTSENNDKLSATPGTFSDLNEKIENAENGVLDLEYNFTYDPEEDGDSFKYGISIAKTSQSMVTDSPSTEKTPQECLPLQERMLKKLL